MTTTMRTAYGYTIHAGADQGVGYARVQFDNPVDRVVLTVGGFPADLAPSEYVVTVESPEVATSNMNWSYSEGLRKCFRYLPPANSRGLSTVPGLSVTEPARIFVFRIAGRMSPRAEATHFLRTLSVTTPSVPRLDACVTFWPGCPEFIHPTE